MTEKVTPTIARDVTEWYPAEVKPVYVGVYETDLWGEGRSFGFSYWDGYRWGNQHGTVEQAEEVGDILGVQNKRWRGLRSPA